MKKIIIFGGIIISIILLSLSIFYSFNREQITINSFEDCIAAGNPAMESYPRQCRDSLSDKTFVEVIDDAWRLDDIQLMQHETERFYGCFGCGATLCVDPIPEMKFVEETENRYCDNNFRVIEK